MKEIIISCDVCRRSNIIPVDRPTIQIATLDWVPYLRGIPSGSSLTPHICQECLLKIQNAISPERSPS